MHQASPPVFYTLLQRRLHWLVIVLLCCQYLLQAPMREALAAIERQETLSFVQFLVTTAHSWGGIAIALIMCWRWQLRKSAVPLNAGKLTLGHAHLVRIHHVSLYVMIGIMAVTGFLHYFAGLEFAERLHEVGKWVLLLLIATHIGGAVFHAKDGNGVLKRMMGRDSLR